MTPVIDRVDPALSLFCVRNEYILTPTRSFNYHGNHVLTDRRYRLHILMNNSD